MGENIIEMSDIHMSFNSEKILKGINFSVKKGEIAVIKGGSGQGKTTMIRIMLGLVKPDSGSVLVFGQNIFKIKKCELKKIRLKSGVSFQGNALFDSDTVYNNVALPLREHTTMPEKEITTSVMSMLEIMEISNASEKYPAQLSGGMRKRVSLARALIMEPKILILDEPTAGLDDGLKCEFYNIIAKLKKRLDISAVIISHDFPMILELANCVAFLNNGIIAECLTRDELINKKDG